MDPLIALLMIVMTVLTVLLVIVGVQIIMILKEARESIQHLNKALTTADKMLVLVSQSASNLETTFSGMKTGMKLVEAFVAWVKEHAPKTKSSEFLE